MYQVRRVNIGKTKQLEELAHACGELYSKTVVFFWRTVRHKGIWLKCAQMERIFTSDKLHAHTRIKSRISNISRHHDLFPRSIKMACKPWS